MRIDQGCFRRVGVDDNDDAGSGVDLVIVLAGGGLELVWGWADPNGPDGVVIDPGLWILEARVICVSLASIFSFFSFSLVRTKFRPNFAESCTDSEVEPLEVLPVPAGGVYQPLQRHGREGAAERGLSPATVSDLLERCPRAGWLGSLCHFGQHRPAIVHALRSKV